MLLRFVSFGFAAVLTLSCKTTTDAEDPGRSLLASVPPDTGLLVVGLDGPHDDGEVNQRVADASERCFEQENLVCVLVVKAGDLSYKNLTRECADQPRCRMFFFRSEDELAALMTSLRSDVKVGLLIGHHAGEGVLDFPTLTLTAFDDLAAFPLVLQLAGDGGSGAEPTVIPVAPGAYSESDARYVTIVQALLNEK